MWLVTAERRGIPVQERRPDEQSALARMYELGDLGLDHPSCFPAGCCGLCNRPTHVDDLRVVAGCTVCPDCVLPLAVA